MSAAQRLLELFENNGTPKTAEEKRGLVSLYQGYCVVMGPTLGDNFLALTWLLPRLNMEAGRHEEGDGKECRSIYKRRGQQRGLGGPTNVDEMACFTTFGTSIRSALLSYN